MTKQKAIEKAYGEHWESLKNIIDSNGYCSFYIKRYFKEQDICSIVKNDKLIYRPKSLRGLETNNGWIKIESEDDLPIDEDITEFWIMDDEEIIHAQFMHDSKSWYDVFNLNLRLFPTHYQPIQKPQPPIY